MDFTVGGDEYRVGKVRDTVKEERDRYKAALEWIRDHPEQPEDHWDAAAVALREPEIKDKTDA